MGLAYLYHESLLIGLKHILTLLKPKECLYGISSGMTQDVTEHLLSAYSQDLRCSMLAVFHRSTSPCCAADICVACEHSAVQIDLTWIVMYSEECITDKSWKVATRNAPQLGFCWIHEWTLHLISTI